MTVAEDLMRAMVQGVTLETMARHLVGDGGSPNMFFVTTSDDKVTAVFTDLARAKQYAETFGLWRIEDRQTGEVLACQACLRLHDLLDRLRAGDAPATPHPRAPAASVQAKVIDADNK